VGAIFGGHKDLLKWLFQNGFRDQIIQSTAEAVASFSVLEMLKFLVDEFNVLCTKQVFNTAAKVGKLDIIQWGISQGLPISRKNIMISAAGPGDDPFGLDQRDKIRVLQWGRKEGFPWNAEELLEAAARAKDLKIYHWVLNLSGNPDLQYNVKVCQPPALPLPSHCPSHPFAPTSLLGLLSFVSCVADFDFACTFL
jgi:hypothetical protein